MHVRVFLSRYRSYTTCSACRGGRLQPEALCFKIDGQDPPRPLAAPRLRPPAWFIAIDNRQSPISNPDRQDPRPRPHRNHLPPRLPRPSRPRLPHPRPPHPHPLRRRDRARQPHHLPRRLPHQHPLRPRRTHRRPPPPRHRPPRRRHARPPRQGQHPGRRRARGSRHARRRPPHRHRPRRAANTAANSSIKARLRSASSTAASPRKPRNPKLNSSRHAHRHSPVATGERSIPVPAKRRKPDQHQLKISGATRHNLRKLDVDLPLGLFCLRHRRLRLGQIHPRPRRPPPEPRPPARPRDHRTNRPASAQISRGAENISRRPASSTNPRSPAPRAPPRPSSSAPSTRSASSSPTPRTARARGLTPGFFSFNSGAGRCDRCWGNGFEKVEMQFLSDLYVTCPECDGRRYTAPTLEITFEGKSIADILELTVDRSHRFLRRARRQPAAKEAPPPGRSSTPSSRSIEVGLGYLRLGQPLNTLSGGESQRLKLCQLLAGHNSKNQTPELQGEPPDPRRTHHRPPLRRHRDACSPSSSASSMPATPCSSSSTTSRSSSPPTGSSTSAPKPAPTAARSSAKAPPKTSPPLDTAHRPRPRGPLGHPPRPSERRRLPSAIQLANRQSHPPIPTRSPSAAPANTTSRTSTVDIPRDQFVVVSGLSGSGKSTLAFDILFAEGQRRFLDSMSAYARQFAEQLEKPDIDRSPACPPPSPSSSASRRAAANPPSPPSPSLELPPPALRQARHPALPGLRRPGRQTIARRHREHHPRATARRAPSPSSPRSSAAARATTPKSPTGPSSHGFTRLLVDGQFKRRRGLPAPRALQGTRHRCRRRRSVAQEQAETPASRHELAPDRNRRRRPRDRQGHHPPPRLPTRSSSSSPPKPALPGLPAAPSRNSTRACSPSTPPTAGARPAAATAWSPQTPPPLRQLALRLHARRRNRRRPQLDRADDDELVTCPACDGARLNEVARAVRLLVARSRSRSHEHLARPSPPIDRRRRSLVAETQVHRPRRPLIARDILPEIRQRLAFLERGRPRLPPARPLRQHPLRRRSPAHPPRRPARLQPPRRPLRPRRTHHRPPPARQPALLDTLIALRDKGNSLLVVEHDEDTMRRADHLIDLGPGAGRLGGEVVYQGPPPSRPRSKRKLRKQTVRIHRPSLRTASIPLAHPLRGARRKLPAARLRQDRLAQAHRLPRQQPPDIDVRIPLGRLTVITGISGSGKSSLMRGMPRPPPPKRRPRLQNKQADPPQTWKSAAGFKPDQARLRSRPVPDRQNLPLLPGHLRQDLRRHPQALRPAPRRPACAASTPPASPSTPRAAAARSARATAAIKLEMDFLPTTWVHCEACNGNRYNPATLEIRLPRQDHRRRPAK